jgi:hypothetical protein
LICAICALTLEAPARAAWTAADPVPAPCNGIAQTPTHRLFRDCNVVLPLARSMARERTRVLIKGDSARTFSAASGAVGYYGGKVENFSSGAQWNMPFATPVCDIWANETCPFRSPTGCAACNAHHCWIRDDWILVTKPNICDGCDGRCRGYNAAKCGTDPNNCTGTGSNRTCAPRHCTWCCDCARWENRFYLDVQTCGRELAWIRGAWIRNISLQWLKTSVDMQADGKLVMPALGTEAQEQRAGAGTAPSATPPCAPLAEAYMEMLKVISESKVWNFWTDIRPEMCSAAGAGKSLAACHLQEARNAIEAMYIDVMTCVQMSNSITHWVEYMIRGAPYQETFTFWGGNSITVQIYPTFFNLIQGKMRNGPIEEPSEEYHHPGCKKRCEDTDEFDDTSPHDDDDSNAAMVNTCYDKYVTGMFLRELSKGVLDSEYRRTDNGDWDASATATGSEVKAQGSAYRWDEEAGRWPITTTVDY